MAGWQGPTCSQPALHPEEGGEVTSPQGHASHSCAVPSARPPKPLFTSLTPSQTPGLFYQSPAHSWLALWGGVCEPPVAVPAQSQSSGIVG